MKTHPTPVEPGNAGLQPLVQPQRVRPGGPDHGGVRHAVHLLGRLQAIRRLH